MGATPLSRYRFTVAAAHEGMGLERYLLQIVGLRPRSAVKSAFAAKHVLINQAPARRTTELHAGDEISVRSDQVSLADEHALIPNQAIALKVLAETSELIAIDKPAGQSAHPLRPTETDTALNALVARYPEAAQAAPTQRPLEGLLVHRIDRGTSGVLVCARHPGAWNELRGLWKSRALEKVYLAWVKGRFNHGGGLRLWLSHDPKSKKRMAAQLARPARGQAWEASTEVMPLVTAGETTLVLVRIHTGVMHQIRVTLAALGHPVLGDEIYGGTRALRESPEVAPLATDTAGLFKRLARALAPLEGTSPKENQLPPRGFFLHALWLRAEGYPGLEQGVLAPVPGYFGLESNPTLKG